MSLIPEWGKDGSAVSKPRTEKKLSPMSLESIVKYKSGDLAGDIDAAIMLTSAKLMQSLAVELQALKLHHFLQK